jgi:hypothetical protein
LLAVGCGKIVAAQIPEGNCFLLMESFRGMKPNEDAKQDGCIPCSKETNFLYKKFEQCNIHIAALKKKFNNTHWTRFSEIIHVCIAAAVKEPSKRISTLDTLLYCQEGIGWNKTKKSIYESDTL